MWFDGLPGGPEKGQEEGQEAQGELIWPGGCPPGHFKGPWASWPSSWPFSGPPGSPSNHLILQPALSHPTQGGYPPLGGQKGPEP